MDTNQYDIQFSGDLLPGADPASARKRIQSLFNLSDASVAQLFSGRPLKVRRGVDKEAAARYRNAFRDAGTVVRVVPVPLESSPAELPLDPVGWTPPTSRAGQIGDRLFHRFEKVLAGVPLSLISVIAVSELCFVLYKDMMSPRGLFLLDLGELFEVSRSRGLAVSRSRGLEVSRSRGLEVFGMFLMVLIAVELMASIYTYMMDKSVHVELMLLIAITALTREVVVMDLEDQGNSAMYMIGLAALLGILIGGYYLVKRLALGSYRFGRR